MIFGLAEEEDEQLSDRVGKVFEEIGIKPRVEACRLGKLRQEGKTRPVKVTVSSATVVNSVMLRARELKHCFSEAVFNVHCRDLEKGSKCQK